MVQGEPEKHAENGVPLPGTEHRPEEEDLGGGGARKAELVVASAVSMVGMWMAGPGARRAAMWAWRSGARRGMAGGGGGVAARANKAAGEAGDSSKYAEKLEQKDSSKKKADVPLAMLKADGSSKRFYNKAWIDEIKVDDQRTGNATTAFCLTLDGRLVRTPANKLLTLPNEIMGMAVALEFDVQGANIHPFTMPITTLATTAIDQIAKSQVPNPKLQPHTLKPSHPHTLDPSNSNPQFSNTKPSTPNPGPQKFCGEYDEGL